MKKKLLSLVLSLGLISSMTACGSEPSQSEKAPDAGNENSKYTVGICQFTQHPALDAATEGFMARLEEKMPGEVEFDVKNASNDIPTCGIIATGFASNNVDLMLANATPALQACASATLEIPVLGTAVTEYGVALEISDFSGTVGGNISGTADLAPLDQQAALFEEYLPEKKNIGILYCSAEANSVYQGEVMKAELEKQGKNVRIYTFADSNDVNTVTATACSENDALYIPTDNTAATCAEAINSVAEPAGIPIIAGDMGIAGACGVLSLCVDYYELGKTTADMAVRVLNGEDISTMPIEYFPQPLKKYNPRLCEVYGIEVSDEFTAIE